MTRYLALPAIRACIGGGRPVEQFLGGFVHEGEPAIQWVEIRPEPDGVALLLYRVYDEGDEEYLDVYAFAGVDDDPDERDSPAAEHRLSTLEEALLLARELYAADPDRFVNAGVIQDEYGDYLQRRNA